MKKILTGLASAAILASPLVVFAAMLPGTAVICCGAGPVVDNITNWLFAILIAVAVIFILIAAFHFITAAGDPAKTEKARNYVLYALIGVVVAFVAKALVMFAGSIVSPGA